VLTLDRPGSAANIFDRRALVELGEELDSIEAATGLKGLIITSAKRSIFVAGADLKSINENPSPAAVNELVELGQSVTYRIGALKIPTAAAIHGAAVGGGYEICLACDYRVASNDKATKLGLPETQIGLLPAWGGATRLPRLIGLPKALGIILAGKTLPAKRALKTGMVDAVVPAEYVVETAAKMLARGKRKPAKHRLVNNRVAATLIGSRLRRQLHRKTRGNYPAVLKALEVVTSGIGKTIAQSLILERKGILELAQTEACRNLIGLFFLQEKAKKRALPGNETGSSPAIARTAVIGAGVMGAGIAQWLSSRRFPVILRDINPERVAAGMGAVAKVYQDAINHHVFTPTEAREGMDRVQPAPTEVPLRNLDLVIEAAVEDLDLKKKIFQQLDTLAGDDTILATNTSALPISELAAGTKNPERVVGLHFFNPVHRMQLVEIVAARQTSPETLSRALQFVQQIGKLPVIVKDSPGFLVNRILMPYLVEAGALFESGVSIERIDEAMLDFGMPMGPLRLLDEVGIDVAMHVARTLAAGFRDRMVVPQVLHRMAVAGLLGRKSGAGFYLHQKGKEPWPNPQATQFAKGASHSITSTELQSSMALLMVNEAARCLEEGIVEEAADVDFAMVMGTGFAPFRGGPLRYADTVGAATLVATMDQLVAAGASHFAPCELLRTMAAEGKKFYGLEKIVAKIPARPLTPAVSPSEGERENRGQSVGETSHLGKVGGSVLLPPLPSRRAESQGEGSNGDARRSDSEPHLDSRPQTSDSSKPAADEGVSLIDTSKMSNGQRAALELTEAARETVREATLASGLFMGSLNLTNAFPAQTAEDRQRAETFLSSLETLLHEKTDPDEIDRTGEIPQPVLDELARLGAFGIKVAPEYGGLGLSQTNYCRAAMLLGGWCGNLTALLSAHQSIGVPQPLILFGTEEQKRKYLPRVARGEISAFALTESGVGSDPATMKTHAEPTPDGEHFILNGEKLWCTNGIKAGVLVVMAKTPPKMVGGKAKEQVTAFIVETNWPGVNITHRCRFMGLKALYNAVIRFDNVRVPRSNILLAEGKGLRVALTTLNTGRLTLPAACVGLAQRCLDVTRQWTASRVQWGAPIGKHAAIADKLARMAANTFAMEAMTLLAASRVDRDKHADVRLEAAMCKMWGTEQAWEIANDALQIRGGRGYETADSLKARGEEPVPLERFLRDCRINTIFEGSSEIMRLFIAREALDPHLKVSAAALDSRLPIAARLRAAGKAAIFYAKWYPRQWLPFAASLRGSGYQPRIGGTAGAHLSRQLRYVSRTSRRLARALFHAMLRHGPKLERQQVLLGRFVEIATELFAITATCLRAEQFLHAKSRGMAASHATHSNGSTPDGAQLLRLVDYFCKASSLRIEERFRGLKRNTDRDSYRVAQDLLKP
jgi:3-hydroxyacyl-CoA dehydrogenase/alkylation response protein AidB-like acyl-CoA dehydrogenase/enoyl-CoA hydratase/carnithine racemase